MYVMVPSAALQSHRAVAPFVHARSNTPVPTPISVHTVPLTGSPAHASAWQVRYCARAHNSGTLLVVWVPYGVMGLLWVPYGVMGLLWVPYG
jgi:hypothetical protein